MKIVTSPQSSQRKITDFDEILYTNADLELDDSHVTKYKKIKFKMADAHHFKNCFSTITQQPLMVG